jgi:hypothetical protein
MPANCGPCCSFVKAVTAARAAGNVSCEGNPDALALLLTKPPLLLACDTSSLGFWAASAPLADRRQLTGTKFVARLTATPTTAATGLLLPQQALLVGPLGLSAVSRVVQEVVLLAQQEEEQQRQHNTRQGDNEGPGMGGACFGCLMTCAWRTRRLRRQA